MTNMDKVLNTREIKSLISLIDDNEVYDVVKEQIIKLGSSALAFIDEELESCLDLEKTSRLKSVYDKIRLDISCSELKNWRDYNSENLFKALAIISKFQYPNLDLTYINKEINRIKDSLWLELNDNLTALEKVRVLNNIFFNIYKFSGDSKDFFNPINSFLIDVLERKKGNPISICSLYSIVAQSVGIPIYGINLPKHYIVAYVDRLYANPFHDIKRNNILFYINPFSGGEIYSLSEVFGFLHKLNVAVEDSNILPCQNEVTVSRMLKNLISIYNERGDEINGDKYNALLNIFEE